MDPVEYTPQQLAQYVATLIDDAAAAYEDFAQTTPSMLQAQPVSMDAELMTVLRDIGSEIGVTLANASRLVDNAMLAYSQLHPDALLPALDDPRYLTGLFRALLDSFVLISSITDREDLRSRPLLHPKRLRSALVNETTSQWLAHNRMRTIPSTPVIAHIQTGDG